MNLLWTGSQWTSLAVANPAGGNDHVVVFDPASAGTLTVPNQDMKRFRANVGWEQFARVETFSRNRYAMAIDPLVGRIVLFGGSGSLGNMSGMMRDTQLWNGRGWQQLAVTMQGATRRSAMVFDLARRVFVHFGGERDSSGYFADTWELVEDSLPPATSRPSAPAAAARAATCRRWRPTRCSTLRRTEGASREDAGRCGVAAGGS